MYEKNYENSLNPKSGDLKKNLLEELRDYFKLSTSLEELYETCKNAPAAIQEEWTRSKIDPKDQKAVTKFYVKTQLYCYELLALEIDAPPYRQHQLEEITQFLKGNSKLKGCDYGSGIGTLGIYLNKNGVHCDFADVSETNLNFIQARLKVRGLKSPKTMHLIKTSLPADQYDFVTAFDVIEHLSNPVDFLKEMSSKLKVGGYFIFNLLYNNEEGTPHLLRDPNLIRKNIRGFGLKKTTSFGEFKVYQKVTRSNLLNSLIHSADSFFWDFREKFQRHS